MPEVRVGRRPLAAVTLLVVTACGPLLDVIVGTNVMDTPVTVLVAVAAGFAAGAWLRPVPAALGCAVDACLLTLASQVADPGAYPVADDLFFFTLLVGGPALGGALVTARRDQVRELRRLSAVARRAAGSRGARRPARGTQPTRRRRRAGTRPAHGRTGRAGLGCGARAGRSRDPGRARPHGGERARSAHGDARRAGSPSQPGARRARRPDLREDEAPVPRPRANRSVTWADLVVGCCGVPLAFEAVVGAHARGPAWANVLVGLAVGAPLVLRRRWPIISVAAMFVLARADECDAHAAPAHGQLAAAVVAGGTCRRRLRPGLAARRRPRRGCAGRGGHRPGQPARIGRPGRDRADPDVDRTGLRRGGGGRTALHPGGSPAGRCSPASRRDAATRSASPSPSSDSTSPATCTTPWPTP